MSQVKKNNPALVSDADQEISTLGPMGNAGNSANLVSGIIRLPRNPNPRANG